MSYEVPIADLVGRDISGWVANVTNPLYRHQYKDDPKNPNGRIRKLIIAEYRKENHKRWLYLRWERDTGDMSDCGYSGWRSDGQETPTVEILFDPSN